MVSADSNAVFENVGAGSGRGLNDLQQAPRDALGLGGRYPLQSAADVQRWRNDHNDVGSVAVPGESSPVFILEDPGFTSPSPSQQYSPSAISFSVSPPASGSPSSPAALVKWEGGGFEHTTRSSPAVAAAAAAPTTTVPKTTAPIPIRKVNNANRVQKRKTSSPSSSSSVVNFTPSSTGSSPSSAGSAPAAGVNKFFVVTPSTISRHADKPNPFECFEALARPSQRGRKGPLATGTKQNALQVRRKGACFGCVLRKVRCDEERPCRRCLRAADQVPEVVCWQFSDFTPVLFPQFIRGHLRREEVARFVEDNIASFTVGGAEMPCTVQLFSGIGFSAVLEVRAKFFTAKTPEVLQHWHMQMGRNSMDLHSRGAAPIGWDMESADAQRHEVKRRVREYIQAIVDEPRYAELVTPGPQATDLARKVLRVVHEYAARSEVPMVRRALSIYAMHFVMTRHLCLTPRNIADLQGTGLVPQGVPFVTPRVLNRQLKAIIDDMLCREMQLLFENFSKSLKPKQRRDWAPCTASFLVLCLFMESVETAADLFVISDNEINLRQHYEPTWKRSFVLDVNRQIENLPFKQFAFQFHNVYQTHSRDASARGFNPLVDDACFEAGELDRPAADMARKLRRFISEDCKAFFFFFVGFCLPLSSCPRVRTLQRTGADHPPSTGAELDFLTADPILPNTEDYPYPRNVSHNYTGRLVAKFLLSFTDERYLLDAKL